ncbi:pleckstrin domain-containing family A member 5 [Caerostris extrusa]|uniref:Pleckstrin domain-containing family A member 5 n=1 Tax=Caerostris extrusa TaxID=172846 RepID=A0AAV4Q5P2_CAEEX|nr:pleckstrin domain-containing family A member 5 [Caerostris extrusa]
MYLETDLDTMQTRDLASMNEKDLDDIPVYVNAEEINNANEEIYENLSALEYVNVPPNSNSDGTTTEQCSMQDINDADERMKRFYGIIPKEKPSEIKTVRIVKRQSERQNRKRDKKRVTYDDQSSVWVVEEPDLSSDDLLEVDEGISNKNIFKRNKAFINSFIYLKTLNRHMSDYLEILQIKLKKSASSGNQDRTFPIKRSKRRHYTDQPRSRDDVDMERCLRTANTPDIRSGRKAKQLQQIFVVQKTRHLPEFLQLCST